MNEQQKQNTIEYAKNFIEHFAKENLSHLEGKLVEMEESIQAQKVHNKNQLILSHETYQKSTKRNKEKYGLEFPEIQKKYEELLPQINKYLPKIKVEKLK